MENNTNKILKSLAETASAAAEEAKAAMQSAGKAVADKYDLAKVSLEISRLKADQEKIFADMGREVYEFNTSMEKLEDGEEAPLVRSKIDMFLLAAEQKQQEIDALHDRQAQLTSNNICAGCGHICGENDTFCSICGIKLK